MTITDPTQVTLYVASAGFDVHASSFAAGTTRSTEPFPTREDADAFVALFPKSCKLRSAGLSTYDADGSYHCGTVSFRAGLLPDGVNGGRNETGIKRYRTFLATCEKLGVTVTWTMPYSNAITEAELEALIA